MLWKESTTSIFETYFWIRNTTEEFFLKTLRMKTMKDFPKTHMNSDVFAWT